MANTDKDIVITPNKGSSTSDPIIVFTGANSSTSANITLSVTPTNNGTVAFSGSAGQLFSVVNSMTGNIFNVNDVSGIPLIQATDTGNVFLAPLGGNVGIGNTTITSGYKLDVTGNIRTSGNLTAGTGSGGSITGANVISANYFSGAGNGLSNLQLANISGIGNVSTVNLNGNISQVLSGIGTWVTPSGGGGNTTNSVTFNSGGLGSDPGLIWNGGAAVTVSYNTVGAPSITGTNASGVWGISVSGSAGSVTSASQSNITSVGTLTSLTVSGNISGGNLTTTGQVAGTRLYIQGVGGNDGRLVIQPGTSNTTLIQGLNYANNNGNISVYGSLISFYTGDLGASSVSERLSIYGNGQISTVNGGALTVSGNITLTGTQTSGILVPRTYTQSGGTSISVTSGYGYRSYDFMDITSVSSNFTLTADSGSSYKSYINGQKLMIKLTASGSISITVGSGGTYPWNQITTVPTAMTSGQILYIGAVFNSNTSKWDIIAAKVG